MSNLPEDADCFVTHLRTLGDWQQFSGYRQRLKNNFHDAEYTDVDTWAIAAVKMGYNEWTTLNPLPAIPDEAEGELNESTEERKRRTRNLTRRARHSNSQKTQAGDIDFDVIPRSNDAPEYFACIRWVFRHMGDTKAQLENLDEAPGPAIAYLRHVLSDKANFNKFIDIYHKCEAIKSQKEMGKQALKDDGRRQMSLITDFMEKEDWPAP